MYIIAFTGWTYPLASPETLFQITIQNISEENINLSKRIQAVTGKPCTIGILSSELPEYDGFQIHGVTEGADEKAVEELLVSTLQSHEMISWFRPSTATIRTSVNGTSEFYIHERAKRTLPDRLE